MPKEENHIIQFGNLSAGKHSYSFKIKDSFFEQFENSEIRQGNFLVKVEMQKQTTMLILDFHIKGKANVECDRCGDEFLLPVTGEQSLLIKLDGEDMDDNDEIVSVASSENVLNISQYIYEYIILSLPLRRVHPDKKGKSNCNPEVIKKLSSSSPDREDSGSGDPRWNVLKNIKLT